MINRTFFGRKWFTPPPASNRSRWWGYLAAGPALWPFWKKCGAGCIVFFLLLTGYRLLVTAALTGGVLKISALSTTSGGGAASGGVLALKAASMGGLTGSGARLSGGNLSVTTGGTPAVVTFATAKSDLSAAHCYPVPFKPSLGHTKITFTDLTRSARIRIYTTSGILVRALDKSDTGETLDWDVRNARGEAVVSGVYLYVVNSASQTRKGKLMIIR